jgi:hypothetical protein
MKTKLLLPLQNLIRTFFPCMFRRLFLILALSPAPFALRLAVAQVPQGFNYQAIARDGSGNPIVGATIKVKLSILTDTTGFRTGGGTYQWEEEHTGVVTNAYGLFNIVLGDPSAIRTLGVNSFDLINWSLPTLYIGTKIANPTTYKVLGGAKLWSVPYSMNSGNISGPLKKLSVKGETTDGDSILFEVKNKTGQTIFAVYNEGVRIYVDNGDAATKGNTKGGFAIGGFGTAKTPSQEYFRVTRDSTRVYVNPNPPVKGNTKGGFAIGGFGPAKGSNNSFLDLTPENYFIGHQTGNSLTTGKFNSFLGYQAGYKDSTGAYNNFIGYQSGYKTTNGNNNAFMGYMSGYENRKGSSNTFIGNNSGKSNIDGNTNTFIGTSAGQSTAEGSNNTFMGAGAGYTFLKGSSNILIGSFAGGLGNFTGVVTGPQNNVIIGSTAGVYINSGINNVFLGNSSGFYNTSGSNNVFLGMFSGFINQSGSSNVFLGDSSGYGNTNSFNVFLGKGTGKVNTGQYNSFMGYQAGMKNTSGANNVFLGTQSGYTNSTGNYNVFIGTRAGKLNNLGFENTFIGFEAGLSNIDAPGNTFVGTNAGRSNQSGYSNTFLGNGSGKNNTSGYFNVFAGIASGQGNISGVYNTYLGWMAGYANTNGQENVFLGAQSGAAITTGDDNVFLGPYAGSALTSGYGNVFIGPWAGMSETLVNNKLYISNSNADKNNALIYGEFDAKKLSVNGSLSIGKINPLTKLDIEGGNYSVSGASQGDFRIGSGGYSFNIGLANGGGGAGDVRLTVKGGTNRMILGGGGIDILTITNAAIFPWTDAAIPLGLSTNRWQVVYSVNGTIQTSDARLKTNIQEIGYGLETILKLRPVSFTWKNDILNVQRLGLIAQDVQKVLGEVVDSGNDSEKTLGINYSEIVPVLIKGMQEQQSQIEAVKQENSQLKSINESLCEQIKSLENRMLQIESVISKSGGR